MNGEGYEPMEVGRLTITRVLDDEDGDTVRVEVSEGLTLIEALGMLRLSEDTLITTQMFTAFDEDDDDTE